MDVATRQEVGLALYNDLPDWFRASRPYSGTDERLRTYADWRRVTIKELPPFPVPFQVGNVLHAPIVEKNAVYVWASGRLWKLGRWEISYVVEE